METRRTLINDGGAEAGFDGWGRTVGPAVRNHVDENRMADLKACELAITGAGAVYQYSYAVDCVAGDELAASCYALVHAGTVKPLHLRLVFRTSNNSVTGEPIGAAITPTALGEVRTLEVGGIAPPQTAYVEVQIRCDVAGAGDSYRFDNLTICRNDGPPGTPFTGDTPDQGDYTYEWVGTPYASHSVEIYNGPPAEGTAAGTTSRTGSASGSAPAIEPAEGATAGNTTREGAAAGATEPAGTTTGNTTRTGAVTGTATMAGQAVGTTARTGAAAGTTTTAGTAAGTTTRTGSTTGTTATAGSAAGNNVRTGSATGATTTRGATAGATVRAGAAAGRSPGVDEVAGTTTGATARTGSAAGITATFGATAGATARAGSAGGGPTGTETGEITAEPGIPVWSTHTTPRPWETGPTPRRWETHTSDRWETGP